MHIRTAVLAAFVAAGPAVALAQVTPSVSPAPATTEAAQPAAPAAPQAPVAAAAPAEQPPKWTIGAGVGNLGGMLILGSTATTSLLLGSANSTPAATFFLERRVGARTWLLFTGFGSVSRTRLDAPAPGSTPFTTPTDADSELISAAVGLRRVVTRPGALVDVSVYASGGGGYAHTEQQAVDSAGVVTASTGRTGFANVEGGIAVERELTGGLALRLSTPLVGARWSHIEQAGRFTGTQDGWTFSTFVTVSPRIELRLAF